MIKINNSIFEYNGEDTFCYILFKWIAREAGYNLKSAIDKFNEVYPNAKTTPQNISNKLARDSMKLNEFMKFAEVLGYTIYFDDGKIPILSDPKREYKVVSYNFYELLGEGFTSVDSPNFGDVLIVGASADTAAEYIKANLTDGMSETDELLMLAKAQKEFGVECKPCLVDKVFRK